MLIKQQDGIEYAKFEIENIKDLKHNNILGIDFVINQPDNLLLVMPHMEMDL